MWPRGRGRAESIVTLDRGLGQAQQWPGAMQPLQLHPAWSPGTLYLLSLRSRHAEHILTSQPFFPRSSVCPTASPQDCTEPGHRGAAPSFCTSAMISSHAQQLQEAPRHTFCPWSHLQQPKHQAREGERGAGAGDPLHLHPAQLAWVLQDPGLGALSSVTPAPGP